MEISSIISGINNALEITLSSKLSYTQLKDQLVQHINYLIINDFDKLITILYRVDVNETKLKKILEQNTKNDSAPIIADLLIEREEQKIKARNHFNKPNDISDEEKW